VCVCACTFKETVGPELAAAAAAAAEEEEEEEEVPNRAWAWAWAWSWAWSCAWAKQQCSKLLYLAGHQAALYIAL
jgi:hypothetical protein